MCLAGPLWAMEGLTRMVYLMQIKNTRYCHRFGNSGSSPLKMKSSVRLFVGLMIGTLALLGIHESPLAGYLGLVCGGFFLLDGLDHILPK